jgi:hypothetical protein
MSNSTTAIEQNSKNKKTDVAACLQVCRHVGLLVNKPSGTAGLPLN